MKSSLLTFVFLSIMMLCSVSAYGSLADYSTLQTNGKYTEPVNPMKNFKSVTDTNYTDINSTQELLSANRRSLRLPNDLQAVLISGSTSINPETSNQYSVIVRNLGSNLQTDYLVKLYDSAQTELASVLGPALTPGQFATVILSFVAPPAGSLSIYGKVVFSGDQNNLNDQTTPLEIIIIQSTDYIVHIGSETASQRQPFGAFHGYERSASLYTQEQAGFVGQRLVNLAWYCSTISTTPVPYKIYLKTVTDSILTPTPWATMIAGAQLVAEGTKTFDHLGWVNFYFNSFWQYMGGNLVVMVETYYGGVGASQYPQFYKSVGTIGSHQYWYNDNTPPSSNGIVNASLPNIVLDFWREIGPLPFGLAPSTCTFNLRKINTVSDIAQTITSYGSGPTPMIINSITLSGSPMFSLTNIPTLPISLAGMQSCNFTVRYNPTETGTHIAQVTINTNFDSMYIMHSNLSGSCIDPTIDILPYVENFDNVTAPDLPVNWTKATISPGTVTTSTLSPYSLPNTAYLNNSSTSDGPYLISPPVEQTIPISTLRVRFRARGNPNSMLSVGIISDPANTSTYLETTSLNISTTWTEYIVSFRTYAGNGHFVTFKYSNFTTYQHISVDDIFIEANPQNDLAAISISTNLTTSVGIGATCMISVYNAGLNPQTNYTVKLFKEGDVEIASVGGLPVEPGQSRQFELFWTPASSGITSIYGKVILAGDEDSLNDRTTNFYVTVFPIGSVAVTIGDGSQTGRLPMDFGYNNSLSESIYLASEIDCFGTITGIALYSNFVSHLENEPTKIWMGTTNQTDLSAGWIPSTDLIPVFDGVVTYPAGQHVILITFTNPYLYMGDNVVVMFNRPMDTGYYSNQNVFLCQTIGTGRTRNAYSFDTILNPAVPPANGIPTNMFPEASFLFVTGLPHFTGFVYDIYNIPLANATVQILNGGQATTNQQGYYQISNVFGGTYSVTASKTGYISQTQTVTLSADNWPSLSFHLTPVESVTVTGIITGSDAPAEGIPDATIILSGLQNYSATTNASGMFTIPGVYCNQLYNYQIMALGYQIYIGTISVLTTDHNMGTVIVNEIAYPPLNVNAVCNGNIINLTWEAPDPDNNQLTQNFESNTFPPTDWTRIITNNNAAGTNGVYPTWCRTGTVIDAAITVTPPGGQWQCGLWNSYIHQNEWLITPQFNCPQNAQLVFDTCVYLGSTFGEHYYVKITVNNGQNWTILWDASALTGGWNNYQTPIIIDLADYADQQVKIAWNAVDNTEGLWYNWFIDNVIVSNNIDTTRQSNRESKEIIAQTQGKSLSVNEIANPVSAKSQVHLSSERQERFLTGYKVWMLLEGQQQNELVWNELTPVSITSPSYTIINWYAQTPGTYMWAVKAVYSDGILSPAAFSNTITIPPIERGIISGFAGITPTQPVNGAIINAGIYTTTSDATGHFSMEVPIGTYTVACTFPDNMQLINYNVVVQEAHTTYCWFVIFVQNANEIQILQTKLQSNYPNPFNPETTICYDLKDNSPVRIDIFNTRGQHVKTLVNEAKAAGSYEVVWNGKDTNGKDVASGIYHYRMQAGSYSESHRMMLLK